uniref:Uncharacterized protein n=1 Tax=Mycena chlorophos TaxID=658473 RepID=A0ABQ0L1B5_MYCCL|nr:predicted protein [Mycena chlorophos]
MCPPHEFHTCQHGASAASASHSILDRRAHINSARELAGLPPLGRNPAPRGPRAWVASRSRRASPYSRLPRKCFWDHSEEHEIKQCPQLTKDLAAGIVRRNEAGQLVSPSGIFLHAEINNPRCLRERLLAAEQKKIWNDSAAARLAPFVWNPITAGFPSTYEDCRAARNSPPVKPAELPDPELEEGELLDLGYPEPEETDAASTSATSGSDDLFINDDDAYLFVSPPSSPAVPAHLSASPDWSPTSQPSDLPDLHSEPPSSVESSDADEDSDPHYLPIELPCGCGRGRAMHFYHDKYGCPAERNGLRQSPARFVPDNTPPFIDDVPIRAASLSAAPAPATASAAVLRPTLDEETFQWQASVLIGGLRAGWDFDEIIGHILEADGGSEQEPIMLD